MRSTVAGSSQYNELVVSASAHLIFGVLCAEQKCTLEISEVESNKFFSLINGSCQSKKNTSEGVFTLNPGDSCNFTCAEGYFATNGDQIPFACHTNPNKTSPAGLFVPTTLTPCASACFEYEK